MSTGQIEAPAPPSPKDVLNSCVESLVNAARTGDQFLLQAAMQRYNQYLATVEITPNPPEPEEQEPEK